MKWKFKSKLIDLSTAGTRVVVMNESDAQDMDIHAMDRIKIWGKDNYVTAIVDLTKTFVNPGEIGLFYEVYTNLKIKPGSIIQAEPVEKPISVTYIRKKLDGKKLTENEIDKIIEDLMADELTEFELSAFVTATYIQGLDDNETVYLTKAIVNSGEILNLGNDRIFDKHSIGGVPGNRTTMILVPIVASAGLLIPKTSSRAITSPAGTADAMEVLAPVSLSKEEIERVVKKANGCIVWGGAVNLAAADDKLIRIRHPLSLDPKGMLLASIMAKKKAVSATDVIIDIPTGMGAKVKTREDALALGEDFKSIGSRLGMHVKVLLTDGDHPIGRAIGPAIEARETLKILNNKPVSQDLTEKSAILAGILLEMSGKVERGKGRDVAMDIIRKKKALKKFREIVELQGGDPEIKPDDIKIGPVSEPVKVDRGGRIEHINNKSISAIARAAGAPRDKEAGIYMHVEEGDKVKEGDTLFTIYAKKQRKLEQAIDLYEKVKPIKFEKILLEIG